jgi:protein-S-isoprenylcysteine O-methyltransferase Ste14
MLPTIIAYLLIGSFLVFQRTLRQGEQAKSLHAEQFDRGSTKLLGQVFFLTILALITAPILNALQIGRLGKGNAIGWVGIVVMLSGLALRVWANRILGQFYTSTLRVTDRQRIVQQGPYKILRHPGYSGMLLMWGGAGLASANWIATAVIILMMVSSYRYRIISEEAMLLAKFGEEYQAYSARTWKLLPFIY